MQKLFIFVFIISSLLLLSSCSLFHKHEFGEWQTESVPDCTNEGVDARYCECGEKETRSIAALGHTEKVITGSAPSCSKEGLTDGKYCTVCMATTVEQKPIAKTPHTEVIDYGRAPTCKNEGLTDGKHCDTCGKVTLSRQVIPKLAHNEVVDKGTPATCSANGYTDGTFCADCGDIIVKKNVIPALPHTEVYLEGYPSTCVSKGKTDGKVCSVCGEVIKFQYTIDLIPHTVVTDPPVAPTCFLEGKTDGSHCSFCGIVVIPQKSVAKLSHAEILPTCTRWGITYKGACMRCNSDLKEQTYFEPIGHEFVNGSCANCGRIEIDFSDVTLYESEAGYNYLGTLENGKGLQHLYEQIEEQANKFHNSAIKPPFYKTHETEGDLYKVATVYFYEYTFEKEELSTVFELFKQDHPAFYWLPSIFNYNDSCIILVTTKEYSDPKARIALNKSIYDKIEEYYYGIDGETSAYNIALYYFEIIANDNKYAYDQEGEPVSADWAHSIIGAFQYGQFVCAGYTNLFRMFLNMYDIDNYHIISDKEKLNHAWNFARLDDGNYYSFDITWADGDDSDEIDYKYFAATDADSEHFSQISPDKMGWDTVVDLPDRAISSFNSKEVLEIGEQFTVDGSVFTRLSFDTVRFVRGKYFTGDKIMYNGAVYYIE